MINVEFIFFKCPKVHRYSTIMSLIQVKNNAGLATRCHTDASQHAERHTVTPIAMLQTNVNARVTPNT